MVGGGYHRVSYLFTSALCPRSRGSLWSLCPGGPKELPRGEAGPRVGVVEGAPRGYVLSPSLSLGPAGSVGRGLGGHGDPGVSSRVRGGHLDSPPLTLPPTSRSIPILVSAAPPSGARGKRRRDLVRAHGLGPRVPGQSGPEEQAVTPDT